MKLVCLNLVKIILITCLVSSCAAIPGNNVKLENYSDVNKENLKNISLQYDYTETHAGLTNDAYADYYNFFQTNASDKDHHSFRKTYNQYLFFRYWSEGNYELINKIDNPSSIFNDRIIFSLKSKNPSIGKFNKIAQSECVVKIRSNKDLGVCPITNLLVPLTLFIIPYYCQHTYQAQANLIFHPSESSLKGKAINIVPEQINLSQTQTKQSTTKNNGIATTTNYLITKSGQKINEGDYFLDENDRLTKLLKTYELKDKVHEVWSALWMLSWLVVEPKKYAPNAEYPKDAPKIVENTISEALTRSIINDALEYSECYKNSDPKSVAKIQSDAKNYQKNYKEILDQKNKETKEWQNQ